MEKVYSRWPSQAHRSSLNPAERLELGYPRWMIAPSPNYWPERLRSLLPAASLIVLPAMLTFAAGYSSAISAPDPLIAIAAALGVGLALAFAMKSQWSLAESDARYHAIFERAGIGMWLEDWTAVAKEVSALRRNGVADMEAYFAGRPEELRALRAKVMIKDVNAFTLEESGAGDKTALTGSLDRLLPHTDQTFVQWLVAFARGDRFFRSEAHVTKPDGSVSDMLFTAALPGAISDFANIIVTSLDITAYKTEQAKLLAADAEIARASRISTVGALSASIVHEVNTPLAAVLANAQAALRWLRRPTPDIAEASEAIAAIVADAKRAKDVVVRTRAFISNTTVPTAPYDIVAAARDANLLVERELRYCGAAVHIHADSLLPPVFGDIVQIQQVFTNLLLNAAQAMAAQESSRDIVITISRGDKFIQVDVADTGPGVEPERLERLFHPFYTTKPDGMGMGLAICRNCIDAQGGHIWASCGPGQGLTIHFTLPAQYG